MAPRAQFLSKPYLLLLEMCLKAQDVKVLSKSFILTVHSFLNFFSAWVFLAAMILVVGGFKQVEGGSSLGFFFPSVNWGSRKYKDSMIWVCMFSLIPLIQFIEIVLGVMGLVEVCLNRRQVRISVVDLPFCSYKQTRCLLTVFLENTILKLIYTYIRCLHGLKITKEISWTILYKILIV